MLLLFHGQFKFEKTKLLHFSSCQKESDTNPTIEQTMPFRWNHKQDTATKQILKVKFVL